MARPSGDSSLKRCPPCDLAPPLPDVCAPKTSCPRQTGTAVSVLRLETSARPPEEQGVEIPAA